MLKSGVFFAEKDIILHIQSPVYLFIYLHFVIMVVFKHHINV